VVRFTPRPLYFRCIRTRYTLDRSLCGPQSQSERGGEEKKSHRPCRKLSLGHPPRNQVFILGELPRLLQLYRWTNIRKEFFFLICALPWNIRGCIQKIPDWPPGARTANDIALCHVVQLYRYSVSQSSEFCRHNPLCCFLTSNTKGKLIFSYDSIRKLLDNPRTFPFIFFVSCNWWSNPIPK
jgi:hypothetical protein